MPSRKQIENSQKYGLVTGQNRLPKRSFDPQTITIETPRQLKLQDCEDFPSRDRYIAWIKSDSLVEITPNDEGYWVKVYWKGDRNKPVYEELLDKNYQVLTQAHIPLAENVKFRPPGN
ncbi:hypothetical protein Xen7305DRAFT_00008960 [Xenococcus sp. PCC 7305]|uniref:hypothetical protein n=1 Tax=Xenococcus sp. PCC 7305 TaxID=102125 RepID=UPI0002AC51EA|nr:hypothetical protein [Xenococcus sp. PCC 7305]ELS01194.1 hypothetical protein Xen7305DRAFT_00008960 [Xenococcus sp. PCC 7305]